MSPHRFDRWGIDPLTSNSTLYSCVLGAGYPRFYTANPEEMRKIVVQDVCWSHFTPQVAAFRVERGPNGLCILSRRVCRCAET